MIIFQELFFAFLSQVRMDGHEEEVGEVGDWRIPAVQSDVDHAQLLRYLNSILTLVPAKINLYSPLLGQPMWSVAQMSLWSVAQMLLSPVLIL